MTRHRLLLLAAIAAPATLGAQPAATPPSAPSPPHEKLAFFEGLWTIEEVPASRELRERCGWMEGGRRHIVCRSRSKSAAGAWREGLSMMSYRAPDSAYVYYGLRSSGATQLLVGGPIGAEEWEFAGEEGAGATRERTRVRITRLPAGRFRFVEQTALGDAPFAKADTVHYRPARGDSGAP